MRFWKGSCEMAVKKGKIPQALSIDPAVEAAFGRSPDSADPVYGRMDAVRRARNQTPGQRRKAARDEARNKATYDLPADLSELVSQIAARFSVPVSQVAALLMTAGLQSIAAGRLDLRDLELRPSRSPRYDWVFAELPELPKIAVAEL